MIPICDLCLGEPGDHDKPYHYGAQLVELRVRFTREELGVLIAFRRHVEDVRDGYAGGFAFGDIDTDDPECQVCHMPLHLHESLRLCRELDLTSEC